MTYAQGPTTLGNLSCTFSDLSLLYFYEHKLKEAENFAAQALPIQEKAYGPDSLEVSTTSTGWVLRSAMNRARCL